MSSDENQPDTGRKPKSAKILSLGLLVWCGIGAFTLLGIYGLYFYR